MILTACVEHAPSPKRHADTVSHNLSEAKTPVLRSAHFDKAWGKPDTEVMSDGTYMLRYRQGTTLNFVIIKSLSEMKQVPENPPDWEEAYEDPMGTRPAPPSHKQSWRHTMILGKPVKWYKNDDGSGADFPAYRTVDFPLTAPDGRTGFYRIVVCADSPEKAEQWICRVGW